MRWDRFFADLEAQADALERDELELEVADRALVEDALVSLMDRVRASVGMRLRCGVVGGAHWQGTLLGHGVDWLWIGDPDVGAQATLVPARALVSVGGLADRAVPLEALGLVARRFTLTLAMRRLMLVGDPVRLHRAGEPAVTGTLERVGQDYLDLACDDVTYAIPTSAVSGVVLS